jgi:hypothetical protein
MAIKINRRSIKGYAYVIVSEDVSGYNVIAVSDNRKGVALQFICWTGVLITH